MGTAHLSRGGQMYFTGTMTPSEQALKKQWNSSTVAQRAAITRFLNLSPDQQMGLIAMSNRNKDRI